jgi:hypothetical protein
MAVKFGPAGLAPNTLGIGPGNIFANPRYTSTYGLVCTPAEISSVIDNARLYNMCIPINMAGNRGVWSTLDPATGCRTFSQTLYEDSGNRFNQSNLGATLYAKVKKAFDDKIFIQFVGDELHGPKIFCGSCPNTMQNDLGLFWKDMYPGSITMLRIPANQMPVPSGGWTGIDYCLDQYTFKGNPCGGQSVDPAACFTAQLKIAADANLGIIGGMNWLADGWNQLWDTDMDPNTPDSTLAGSSNNQYLMAPARMKLVADGIAATGGLAPIATAWNHVHADFTPQEPFHTYEIRSDFVAAFTYCLNTLKNSNAGHAWNTPKGDTGTGGGGGGGASWSFVGMGVVAEANDARNRDVVFPAGIQPGDLLVLVGYSRDGTGRVMAQPAGYSPGGHVAGGATNGDLVAYQKLATTEGDGTTGDGHSFVSTDWGANALPTDTQVAFVLAFRGVLQVGSVVDVVSAASTWASKEDVGPITGLTATTAGDLLLVLGARKNDFGNGIPTPAGTVNKLSGDSQVWSDPLYASSVLGSDASIIATYAFLTGTPTITSKTFVSTLTGQAAAGCGLMLTFKPIPGTATSIPVLSVIGNKNATVGVPLTFTANATGGAITYSLTGTVPVGATIDHATGVFSWTPSAEGAFTFTVQSSNASGTDTEAITVTVRSVPVLSLIGNKNVIEGNLLSFTISATGGGIAFTKTGGPGGLTIGAPSVLPTGVTQALVSYTPGVGASLGSPYSITITATNTSGTDSEPFQIVVVGPGPVLAPIGPRTVDKGHQLRIACSATHPTGAAMTFSIDPADKPSGTSITSDGVFTWEPATSGVFTCTVKVTDGTYTDSEQFTITVTDIVTTATTDILSGLVAATAYDVRVAHVDPDTLNVGDYALGSPYGTTVGSIPPGPTVTVASAVTRSGFNVNWTNGITGAGVSTTVEYKQAGTVTWNVISAIPSGTVTQAISGLVAGTLYDVRVKHISSGVSSQYYVAMSYVTTTLNPPSVGTPTNFVANAALGSRPESCVLAWTRGEFSEGSQTYVYESATASFSAATLIATLPSSSTSRPVTHDLGLGQSRTYWFWVRHALANGLEGTVVGPVSFLFRDPGGV